MVAELVLDGVGRSIAALDQFGGDAHGDFTRLIRAQRQADRAAEGVGDVRQRCPLRRVRARSTLRFA